MTRKGIVLLAALGLASFGLACGGDDHDHHHDDGHDDELTCPHLADFAVPYCGEAWDVDACVSACEAVDRTTEELQAANDCCHEATDCASALSCLPECAK